MLNIFSPFGGLKQFSICLSKADRKGVIHPGMKPLIAVSEHENWIQVDKSIFGSDPFTVDLREGERGGGEGGGGECCYSVSILYQAVNVCLLLFAFCLQKKNSFNS